MVGRSAVDYHESELVRLEGLKSQIAALQMRHLRHLDQAQAATADGWRSLSEWVAARLDVSHEAAKGSGLCDASRTDLTSKRPWPPLRRPSIASKPYLGFMRM